MALSDPRHSPATVRVVARAKVNLALHIVGRRADGYHLLDSIVAFAALCGTSRVPQAHPSEDQRGAGEKESEGDRIRIHFDDGASGPPRFTCAGPFAHAVPDTDNTVLAAANAVGGIASIHLEKHLPVAAGIGGGSADAAAVLRATARRRGEPVERYGDIALRLGADVPVCLAQVPARMEGIGEKLTPLACPPVPAILVNPGVEVSTPAVFGALRRRDNPPLPAWTLPGDVVALAAWLKATRNDLEPPAIALAPSIAAVIDALSQTAGCLLARMSGSGATVFALYADDQSRDDAAQTIARTHPAWWVRAACIAPPPGETG